MSDVRLMRLRAPAHEDAPAVLAVLEARDVTDLGAPDCTLEDIRDEWRASDLDLVADAVLVENSAARIVGYAVVRERGTLAVVAPVAERQGIGSRLLQWAERRERQRGRALHRQWVAAANARGQALLQAAGYERMRSHQRMARPLDAVVATAAAPTGVCLRALDADADAAAVHALDDVSFAASPGYEFEPFVTFCEGHLRVHDLDPELSRVAERGDRMVGFLLARRWQDEGVGYVDVLAVHPDERGRGLGTALLRGAFARFAAAGLHEAQLGVDSDNPGALRMYERAGMSARFRTHVYERPVDVGSQQSPRTLLRKP